MVTAQKRGYDGYAFFRTSVNSSAHNKSKLLDGRNSYFAIDTLTEFALMAFHTDVLKGIAYETSRGWHKTGN
jgi:hypothetical protein